MQHSKCYSAVRSAEGVLRYCQVSIGALGVWTCVKRQGRDTDSHWTSLCCPQSSSASPAARSDPTEADPRWHCVYPRLCQSRACDSLKGLPAAGKKTLPHGYRERDDRLVRFLSVSPSLDCLHDCVWLKAERSPGDGESHPSRWSRCCDR